MSNRRKLRQHTSSGLTRPRGTWHGHVRGHRANAQPDAGRMWQLLSAYLAPAAARTGARSRG